MNSSRMRSVAVPVKDASGMHHECYGSRCIDRRSRTRESLSTSSSALAFRMQLKACLREQAGECTTCCQACAPAAALALAAAVLAFERKRDASSCGNNMPRAQILSTGLP